MVCTSLSKTRLGTESEYNSVPHLLSNNSILDEESHTSISPLSRGMYLLISAGPQDNTALFGGRGNLKVSFQRLKIIDRKLESVMYTAVCGRRYLDLSCLGRTIYARQFWQSYWLNFCHMWASKWISQTIMLTPSQPVGCLTDYFQGASWESQNLPVFTSLGWHGRRLDPSLPHPEGDALTTRLPSPRSDGDFMHFIEPGAHSLFQLWSVSSVNGNR